MTIQMPHAGLRPVIAIIGKRNAGKSSLLNSITGQEVSIISDTLGTTTDAVHKAYELIPVGPVSFYDTAGIDDEGNLGQLRIKATQKIINRAELIIYVIGKDGIDTLDEKTFQEIKASDKPFIPVFNYADIIPLNHRNNTIKMLYNGISVSAKTGLGIEELKQRIIEVLSPKLKEKPLISDVISPKDTVILVTPIDTAAPKGRLIMPEVQVMREALDHHAVVLTVQPEELSQALTTMQSQPPALVVTDSQVVKTVADIVPKNIPLTTFSMVLARAKWDFMPMLEGAKAIKNLQDNDKILIAEACSHRKTCDDIGRVKIPNMLKQYTQKNLQFDFYNGQDFPEHLTDYALVIHCGGCLLNQAEATHRIKKCQSQGVSITNYGMAISIAQGVLDRVSSPLISPQP